MLHSIALKAAFFRTASPSQPRAPVFVGQRAVKAAVHNPAVVVMESARKKMMVARFQMRAVQPFLTSLLAQSPGKFVMPV